MNVKRAAVSRVQRGGMVENLFWTTPLLKMDRSTGKPRFQQSFTCELLGSRRFTELIWWQVVDWPVKSLLVTLWTDSGLVICRLIYPPPTQLTGAVRQQPSSGKAACDLSKTARVGFEWGWPMSRWYCSCSGMPCGAPYTAGLWSTRYPRPLFKLTGRDVRIAHLPIPAQKTLPFMHSNTLVNFRCIPCDFFCNLI